MIGEPRYIGREWVIMIYKKELLGDGIVKIKEYPLSNIDTEIPFADEVITFTDKDTALKEMEKRGIINKNIDQVIG